MTGIRRVFNSIPYAIFLGLVCPGLGHTMWGEWVFGLFVFLVILITSALVYLSFIVTIPNTVLIPLIVLPLLFYLFSLVDLARSIRSRAPKPHQSSVKGLVFLVLALAYQTAAPSAPGNFLIRNRPVLFRMQTTQFQPDFTRGELVKASSMTYYVNLFLIKAPVFHDLPDYFDVVRYHLPAGERAVGLVVGLPGDQVEMYDGLLYVNGDVVPPVSDLSKSLSGEMPLTRVAENSILVGDLSVGRIVQTHQVRLTALLGRVERIF